jgi:hypothetical protein
MERSYAWIPTCLASDAKMNCQVITGLIGDVGENMNKAGNTGLGKGTKEMDSLLRVILKHSSQGEFQNQFCF